jgi:hypothetical protein
VRDLSSISIVVSENPGEPADLKSGQTLRLGAVAARPELNTRHEDRIVTGMTPVLGHRRAVCEADHGHNESKPDHRGMTHDDYPIPAR